jgi:hypothetical protein
VARRWLTVTQKNEAGEDVVQHNQTDTEGVNVRLNAPRQTIAGMRVTASVGPGLTYTNGRPLQSLVGTVGASRTLGKRGSFNLTYNYNDFGLSSDDSTRYVGLDRQTVTTTLAYAAYPRWSLSAFATLGLEHHSQNVRLSADYRFSNQWSLGVNAGYFRQILSIRDVVDPELFRRDTFGATNVEVRLTRVLGERALSVVYESYRNRVYLDYMPGATW